MENQYVVSARGPRGEPLAISCVAHPGCGWTRRAEGPKTDADPIWQALWRSHVVDHAQPDLKVVGYTRRSRTPLKK